MAEYIERGALIDLLHYHADEACSSVVTDFETIPAADVVEVVRCGKCVHYCGFDHCKNGICDRDGFSKITVFPTDFCSYGEKRSGKE